MARTTDAELSRSREKPASPERSIPKMQRSSRSTQQQDVLTTYRTRGAICQTCHTSVRGLPWVILIGDDRAAAAGPAGIHLADNLVDARDWVLAHRGDNITYRQEPEGFLNPPRRKHHAPQHDGQRRHLPEAADLRGAAGGHPRLDTRKAHADGPAAPPPEGQPGTVRLPPTSCR